jgi:ABC-type multidrug transport system ATPase subunit
MWEVVRGLTATGVTVLLTTQYLEEADVLAGQIAVVGRTEAPSSMAGAGTPARSA